MCACPSANAGTHNHGRLWLGISRQPSFFSGWAAAPRRAQLRSRWGPGSRFAWPGRRTLLRQQREGAVPVLRRWIVPEFADARLVEIVEIVQRLGFVGAAATPCRGQG